MYKRKSLRISKQVISFAVVAILSVTAAITGAIILFRKTPAKAAVWGGTAATSFAGGNGTSGNPYQIATGEQFKYLANLINTWTVTNGYYSSSYSSYNTSSVYYKLTANIDLNNISWTPIGGTYLSDAGGTYYGNFKANFDGGGYVFSKASVSVTSSNGWLYAGLFGYCTGTISNLGVENSSITGNLNTANSVSVGAIAGYSNGTIKNCYNKSTVSATGGGSSSSARYTGGIVGQSSTAATIINCYNTGSISATNNSSATNAANAYAGGIVGGGGTVTNCYNTGSVSGYTYGSNSYKRVGGIAGYPNSVINCYSTGTISCTGNGTTYSGGIVGGASSTSVTLSYCYWLSGIATNACGNSGTTTLSYTFNTSGTVTTKGGTLLAALNEWVTANNSGLAYYYWKDTPYPTYTGNFYNTYTVTYNYNGATGNNTTTSATVTYNSSYTLVVPTRTGHAFKGWYSAASGGTQYTNASGASLAVWSGTANVTLYAQWTANTYTLTYSYNNATGNNTTASATVTYNSSYNLVVPTRTGYTFTGWWSATSGGTQYTNASGASLANWTGTAGITIYAQWTANTYTLTYNYNNATGNNSTASATVTYNASYNLVVPTRTGYTFTGWWSATSGGTQYTNASGASLANWTGTAGITIYAQWTANTYTLTYNYNNATGNNTTASATVTYNSSYTLIVPTRTGYTFTGWWSATSSGTQYTNSSGVSLANWTGTAGIIIYAQWTGYNYTVRFNANNGTGSTSTQSFVYGTAQALTTNSYLKEYFKFMGWATSQANADNRTVTYINSQSVNNLTTTNNGTVDLYAVWSSNFATYYLCYVGGISTDGNSGYVTPGVAIALPTVTEMAAYAPTGMTFAGWYENADLTGTAVTQVLISTAGAVKYYYAKWV